MIHMLTTLAIILIALWLLGMITSYTMGGLIHLLLLIAVIVFLVRVIQGRKLV
jgi:hypothetical protein